MTDEQLDLARRLVASKQWRWVAGMQLSVTTSGTDLRWPERPENVREIAEWEPSAKSDPLPDLTDYATAAVLLRMAMEAGPHAQFPQDDGAQVRRKRGKVVAWYIGERTGDMGPDLGTVAACALLEAWK